MNAVSNCTIVVGNMDAVKIEGGGARRAAAAKSITDAGIAVVGHVGLTPQSISSLGGFRPQGRNANAAVRVVQEAQALEKAGCIALIVECVPPAVGAAVTAAVGIPTIGIGAGPHTSGQVLVYHDLLGMMQHPHYKQVTPKFCKQYAQVLSHHAFVYSRWHELSSYRLLSQVGEVIQSALESFREEVSNRKFPGICPSSLHRYLRRLSLCLLKTLPSVVQERPSLHIKWTREK